MGTQSRVVSLLCVFNRFLNLQVVAMKMVSLLGQAECGDRTSEERVIFHVKLKLYVEKRLLTTAHNCYRKHKNVLTRPPQDDWPLFEIRSGVFGVWLFTCQRGELSFLALA